MSHDKISVEWFVNDGYVIGDRPQRTNISHSEIEDCDTEDDVKELIRDAIEEDFKQNISADYSEQTAFTKALELWREMKAEQATGT